MDNLPYDNLDQLAYCLQITFKGTSNEEINKATEILNLMSKDINRFATSLMNLVVNDHNDEKNMSIKNSACANLCSLLADMSRKSIDLDDHKKFLLQVVLNTMFASNVALALKITLQGALKELYESDKDNDLKNQSLDIVKLKLENGTIEEYSAAFLVLQCVIKTPRLYKQTVSEWFLTLRDSLLHASTNLINGIVAEIKEALASHNHNEKFNNIFLGLKILKLWVATLKSFIDFLGKPTSKKSKTIYSTYIQNVISQQPIVDVLSTILTLQIPTEKQLAQCLFSTSGVTGIDQALNGVKAQVIKCFNKVLEYVFKSKALLNQTLNKFFAFSSDSGIKGILQSVFVLCESHAINLEEAMMDQDLQECMVECLIFLSQLSSYNHIYPILSGFHKRLIMNVCLPLLRTSPSELEKFQVNPEEFVNIAVDTCDDQRSKIAKAQAAHLLEHLCDNIDGAVSFTTIAVLAIIEYSYLHNNNPEVIPEKYQTLSEYRQGLFISKTDNRIRIETCLVVLSNISYLIPSRPDLIEPIENFFKTHHEFFYSDATEPLIRARMCLFVSYYFEVIFRSHSQREFMVLQLKFIVQALSAHNQEGMRAISEQAVDSLSNILLQDNLRPRLENYVQDVIEHLAGYLLVTENISFFEIIEDLFINYKKRLIESANLIGTLIAALVKRAQTEYEAKQKSEKVQQMVLTKIWNIFKQISEDRSFIPKFQEEIESLMEPLFNYLQQERRVSFEEDIMHYVTNVTKVSKTVSPHCWGIFKTFPSIFIRSQKLVSSIFPALNQIIIYGNLKLDKDSKSLQDLVEMAIQGLDPAYKDATEANVCEAALLMHLIFRYLKGISNSDWERMLVACLEKLRSAKKMYLKTKLSGAILCAFISNFKLTESVIEDRKMMNDLLTHYIGDAANFEHPYDRKVLVIGLCAISLKGFSDQVVFDWLFPIFNVLISFLKYMEHMDQTQGQVEDKEFRNKDRKMTPKEILQQFLSLTDNTFGRRDIDNEDSNQQNTDDENDEGAPKSDTDSDLEAEDDFDLMHADENEAKIILDTFESNLILEDEFVVFKNVIYTLKDHNEEMVLKLVNQLPLNKQHILHEVLNSQRITTDTRGGKVATEARRIVKTKTRKTTTNPEMGDQ